MAASNRQTTYEFLADAGQATREVDNLNKSFTGASANAEKSAAVMAGSLNKMEIAAAQSARAMSILDAEILKVRSEMAALNTKIAESTVAGTRNSAETRLLRGEYTTLSATLRQLNVERAQELSESRAIAGALAQEAAAAKAAAIAEAEAAAAQAALAQGTVKTREGFDKLTTRVSVGRGALSGYDAALEGVIRSFGGIELKWAIAIGLASIFLPKILELASGKAKLTQATIEAVKADADAASANIAAANAAVTQKDAVEAQKKVTLDFNATVLALGQNLILLSRASAAEGKETENNNKLKKQAVDLQAILTKQYRDDEQALLKVNEGMKYQQYLIEISTESLGLLTVERQKADTEIRQGVEALIRYGIETGKSREEIIKMAEAANVGAPAIAFLTTQLNSGRIASEQFSSSLQGLRIPNISTGATDSGLGLTREQLNARIADQRAAKKSEEDILLSNTAAFAQQRKEIEANIKANDALNKTKRSQAETEKLVNKTLIESIDAGNGVTAAYVRMTTNTQKAESTARSFSNTLSDLAKKADIATAALAGDSLESRRQKVNAEADALLRGLSINNKAQKSSIDEVERYRRASLARIAIDEKEILIGFANERIKIQIEGIDNEAGRRRAMIEQEIREREYSLKKQLGDESKVAEQIKAIRMGKQQEYDKWLTEERIKTGRNLQAIQIKGEDNIFLAKAKQLSQQFKDEEKRILDSQGLSLRSSLEIWLFRKQLEENYFSFRDKKEKEFLTDRLDAEAKFRDALQRDDAANDKSSLGGTLAELKEIAALRRQLERVGNTGFFDPAKLKSVNNELKRMGLNLNDVNQIFGSSTDSLELIELRLKAIGNTGFSGLLDSFDALFNKFNLAEIAASTFANALQGAFTQAIVDGKNFMEVFGKLILAGFLSALGQQAIAEGTYHMLAGAAKLFNPLTAAMGAAEIAKGAALVAFGSALVAGASAIQGSLNKNTGGASTGGGATSSATPSTTQRPPTPPVIVQVPTTPANQSPNTIIANVNLDRNGTKDALNGYGYIMGSAVKTSMRKPLQKATKQKKSGL